MREPAELAEVFHSARDLGLTGKLPVVFFDEFDTAYPGEEGDCGWLRYFLAPMQDGVFYFKGIEHKIGRAIFVFAGSTRPTMQSAIEKWRVYDSHKQSDEDKQSVNKYEGKKALDFISRVKGYIDVVGPNSANETPGVLHFIRRATLIRSLLERILDREKGDHIPVKEDMIFAFLNVNKYLNETRSLEAILLMSDFLDARNITASAIYRSNRLSLYIDDPDQFMKDLEEVNIGMLED